MSDESLQEESALTVVADTQETREEVEVVREAGVEVTLKLSVTFAIRKGILRGTAQDLSSSSSSESRTVGVEMSVQEARVRGQCREDPLGVTVTREKPAGSGKGLRLPIQCAPWRHPTKRLVYV